MTKRSSSLQKQSSTLVTKLVGIQEEKQNQVVLCSEAQHWTSIPQAPSGAQNIYTCGLQHRECQHYKVWSPNITIPFVDCKCGTRGFTKAFDNIEKEDILKTLASFVLSVFPETNHFLSNDDLEDAENRIGSPPGLRIASGAGSGDTFGANLVPEGAKMTPKGAQIETKGAQKVITFQSRPACFEK